MEKFKDNYILHLLELLLGVLCAMKLSEVSAVYNSVQQVATNQSNRELYNVGAFILNKTNKTMNKTWMQHFENNSVLNLDNYKKINDSHIHKRDVGEINNATRLKVKSRIWDCSYSFNDLCALKITWLIEKRCTLLRQLKEILDLLKERKNLLSQLGYTTKLVDITTYFVFMNEHIGDVNEKLSKIVYSTSVFEALEPDWASKAQEVIDKWSGYNAYY